jgi:hypothetical protein
MSSDRRYALLKHNHDGLYLKPANVPSFWDGGYGQYAHGTWTSFAGIPNFGPAFVQGTTDGPGTPSAIQYYSWSYGLGTNFPYSSYAAQFAIPRSPVGGAPALSVRFREAGTWGSWAKVNAGTADIGLKLGADLLSAVYADTGNLTVRTSNAAGYTSYLYSTNTLSHYGVWGADDFGWLDENGVWAIRFRRSDNFTFTQGGFQSGSHIVVPSGAGLYLDGGTSKHLTEAAATYGTVEVYGSKNNYGGVRFASCAKEPQWMFNTSSWLGGLYSETEVVWALYYNYTHGSTHWYTGSSLYQIPHVTWSTNSSPTSASFSRGTGVPTGGSNGDVYFKTDATRGIYMNLSGVWTLIANA